MIDTQIVYSLGKHQNAVNDAWEKMRKDNLIERIWTKDYTLWKPKSDEIINRMGWLDAPVQTLGKINYVRRVVAPPLSNKIKEVILLGIGGSSLAANVFGQIFGSHTGYPQLQVLDTTDPEIISKVSRSMNWKKTIFLISSKSGTTLEIISLFQYFYNLAFEKMGAAAGGKFLFITDGGSPLLKVAEHISAYHVFLNNQEIGGRYSALSFPGIVPAALIGVNVEKLLKRAVDTLQAEKQIATGTSLGAVLGTLALRGHDKLTFILPSRWKHFGDWLEQLIAESTGKEGKGILPVLDEPFGDKSLYGKDRVFVIFKNKEETNYEKIAYLTNAGHPLIIIDINDDYDLGSQMFIWEMATAATTHFLGVNPFDQPDVETTKKHTYAMINEYKQKKSMRNEKPALTFAQADIFGNIIGTTLTEAFTNFLKRGTASDYVCLQIYLSPSPQIDKAISLLRGAILRKYALPVTFGYGPRYLHSTGQLHKGDSGNGLFVQLTQNNSVDVDIPDEIGKKDSSHTFGALKAAQARGDWQALTDKGRRIMRLHFKNNAVSVLKNLALNL
jgi:glucose-6-phosphate isomerase